MDYPELLFTFLSTISEDSEISALVEPLADLRVLAFALLAALSVGLEDELIWLGAFLLKQLLMYGDLSGILTTLSPFLTLPPTDVLPSFEDPANDSGLWLVALARELDLALVVLSVLLTKLFTRKTCTCEVEWWLS